MSVLTFNYLVVDEATEDVIGFGKYRADADATMADFETFLRGRRFRRMPPIAEVQGVYKLKIGPLAEDALKFKALDDHLQPATIMASTPISDLDYAPDMHDVCAICALSDVAPLSARLPTIMKTGAAITQAQAVASIRKTAKAPSDAAKHKFMAATQTPNTHAAIFNGRPLELMGAPIAVYHPVFHKFSRELKSGQTNVTHEDKHHAYELILKSSEWYDSESDRQAAIHRHVEHFLGRSAAKKANLKSGTVAYSPDGHVEITSPLCPRGRLMSEFTEIKNGLGQGDCDPTDQAAMAHMWASVASPLDDIRAVSCLPAFLVSISAAHLAVSGSIFVDGITTQYLTDFISLVPPSGVSLDDHVTRIANLFVVLRNCLDELKEYYASLRQPPTTVGVLLPAPHFSSFAGDGGQRYTLTYTKRVFEERKDSRRAVFRAIASPAAGSTPEEPIEVIVKFCARYGADVHREVHDAGAAPKLLYCEHDASVGMLCVVMQYLEASSPAPGASSDGVKRLQDVVRAMGEKGFVHGDIREDNVIWDAEGQPFIIDFDRGGKAGEVFYPWSLNPDIDWADGISPGGSIEIVHDMDMLGNFIHELSLVE
ncbi:hypothetical protein CYLTODRAFT_374171 [Cylindrobasidium torrendii FP15055 ss-10]|uniref:Aminoglycoside phosphotransferase domain-containing protein n=1 Tax=Cylindrobasidium torrendii FP15055 ss-10 TaxID=1314674 RepID=A0A0D7BG68_9AGAR|nr:hypothetical protein CYLTODRAFT_374171 [Cylindrobasidium torrendii FP15055 ss-10]